MPPAESAPSSGTVESGRPVPPAAAPGGGEPRAGSSWLLPVGAGLLLIVLARIGNGIAPHLWDAPLAAGLAIALGALALAARRTHRAAGIGLLPQHRLDNLEDRIETLADARWQLSEQEQGYRDLLDAQEEVIARRDARGRLTFVNRAFCRTFGVGAAAVLGTGFWPSVRASDPAVTSDTPLSRIDEVVTVAGPRWLVWTTHVVPGPGGRGTEVQIVGRDVTRERQHAASLAEARDEAEAASRAKSRFLAAMSHEIRTPMNGILGMAELLRETTLAPEQQSYVEAIDQSAQTLLKLIDEILDFSRIEAGRLALRREPFDIEATAQSVVELMAPAAHEKGLEIAWTIEPDVPRQLAGDEMRVRQILLNLVSNAVKFTERGGVSVSVSRAAEASSAIAGHIIAIEVIDTGIGLPAGAVDTLFAEFERFDRREGTTAGGTGLGLAISRRLARAMGGDITIESRPGLGSAFTATVVLAPVATGEAAPPPKRDRLAGRRILLAFARLIERRALATMLRHAGATVDETSDVRATDEIDIARSTGSAYDLIVVDAGDDPDEAAAALADLRALAGGVSTTGVVLVDACARRSLGAFRAHGYSGYLIRPVRPRTLEARLVPAGGGAEAFGVDGEAPPKNGDLVCRRHRAHILVAEDNPINARLAETMLQRCGCSVRVVTDGAEAVREVEACLAGGDPAFDLVLMDMHMPVMDGLTATRRLKSAFGGKRLPPIIAVTANAFAEDRRICLDAGMDDYLAKPFTRADIEAVIARWTTPDA